MSRAVFLSCSRTKRPASGPLPAVERYDGPLFRVLRGYLGDAEGDVPSVWVISAKYGLISGQEKIRNYDQMLKNELGAPFLRMVGKGLQGAYESEPWDEALMLGGEQYRRAVTLGAATISPAPPLRLVGGSIGAQASTLRRWLRQERGSVPSSVPDSTRRVASILGSTVSISPRGALELAAGRASEPAARRFETWCVDTRVGPVAPKWMVGLLFSKPVSSFRTADARRVLEKLGVVVRHADCH